MNTTQTAPRFNYTQHAWEGSKYRQNENLYGSSLSKAIREELKKAFPDCQFSISSQTYAGGQSIGVALMSAPFNPFNPLTDEIKYAIRLRCLSSFPYSADSASTSAVENFLKETTEKMFHDINQFRIKDDMCLSDKAKEVIAKALGIVQSYNFDDSDSQVDYFHTNFYLSCSIGKWDKPFILKK